MLRITIELVPYGKEEHRRKIGKIEIANDGTGDFKIGNYKYKLVDGTAIIKGELKDHNRMQSAFGLLQNVLNKALV